MSKLQTTAVLKTILETITDSLVRGEPVQIRGFGNFIVKHRGSYEGWNPKTLERVQVRPKKVPYFRVGKDLRMKVNGE